MNRNLYTTDEFGRSADQDAERLRRESKLVRKPRASAYAKYFEGWDAVASIDPATGRRRITRVYTGTRYRPELTPGRRKALRVSYALLYLLSLALFLWALLIPTASNSVWYILLAALIPGFFFAATLLALILCLTAGDMLSIHEYRDGARRVAVTTFGMAWSMAAPVLATIVLFASGGAALTLTEAFRFLLFGISAAAAAVIGRLERGVVYTALPSSNAAAETETEHI